LKRSKIMQLETKSISSLPLSDGARSLEERDTVKEQLLDFLSGRTHGEELLHALYDHILDEPIPERMRALFAAGFAD